eukprot:EC719057.1.p2 GENE.EC719057.1~~EC719057.1.p2  ORF type:complete len:103 (+),score=16.70 EC719057.1:31-339(+)
MKKVLVVFLLVAVIAQAVFARVSVVRNAARPVAPVAPRLDVCPTCDSFMDQVMDKLVNIIANVGGLGSCGALCSKLDNKVEATVCNLLCDYDGITEFARGGH